MAPESVTPPRTQKEFAERFAEVLRAKREDLGCTIDRLVRDNEGVDAATAEAFEHGDGPVEDRGLVRAIAVSYDVDLTAIYPKHDPVEIGPTWVAVKDGRVDSASAAMDDMLFAFVDLIRILRGNRNGPVVGFRRVDIDALAEHFGVAGETVVEGLGRIIGVNQLRQASMEHAYQTGDPTIRSGLADA